MLPVGFEEVPICKSEVYKKGAESETTILVADNSRKSKTFHCLKWEEVVQDLHTVAPNFINVRKTHLGIQTLPNAYEGMKPSSSHCMIELIALNPLKSQVQ